MLPKTQTLSTLIKVCFLVVAAAPKPKPDTLIIGANPPTPELRNS